MQENKQPIQVKMTDRRYVRTEPIYQYDIGHTLDLSVFAEMLPETFQVHFGRSLMGDSITQIGQNCSCPVPDMYAQTAAPIYAWLYIPETETGLTKYTIEIPVQRRARITNQEPTPVERSAIDQEIAALNAGVERAEDAAEAAEAAQAGAEAAEQGASAAEDSAGASAALAAQKAELATQEADRAEAAVEDVTEVAEQAATDLGGIVREAQTQIAGSVQQAQHAAQAASGSATAAAGSAGAAEGSATAADQSAQAAAQKKAEMDTRADEIEAEFTSLKSDIEAKQEAPQTSGTAGQVLGLDAQLHPVWVDQTGGGGGGDAPVQDVQINGTSILDGNGVANVPLMALNVSGLIQYKRGYGLQLIGNYLLVEAATLAMIKEGANERNAVTARHQHESAFYGLAKAAGDTTQSGSSNAVGTYTDEAKAKIAKMLGIPVKQNIILTESDYDTDLGMFVFDAGEGNEVERIFVAGQIVYDEGVSGGNLAVGFGTTVNRPNYNEFVTATPSGSIKRLVFVAVGENTKFPYNNGYYRSMTGFGFYGDSFSVAHIINVDNVLNKAMTSRGTNFYPNFNSPRYVHILAPATPDWAYINIEYTLR